MIYIERNTYNQIPLELTGLTSDTYFLFELIPEMTAEPTNLYITYPNISSFTNRYDLFGFDESFGGTVPFCENGICYILPGQYKYNVYSNAVGITAGNYLTVASGSVLSTGRLVSIGEESYIDEVYQ